MIDFTKQFKEGAEAAENVKVAGKFDRVIFCGMGGSIIPAEMISLLWLEGLNFYIHRTFGIPHWANKKCLVVCTSWSGDTEETISSFEAAVRAGVPVAVITKGGKLLALAQKHKIPYVVLPQDNAPARYGAGYMLAALLTLLTNSAILDNNPVSSFSSAALTPGSVPGLARPNFAKQNLGGLAARISDKTPLIYSSYRWRYLARFWKIFFNEDCKLHSFSNYFPEAAHNEIAGFTATKREVYFPIILIDPDEETADQSKLNQLANFFNRLTIDSQTLSLGGKTRLEKILNSYYLAGSTAEALAEKLGVDPLDNSMIEAFKKS
ncbi:MAG: SIS domain-containing protein [Patescibacteria group bacterium]